jgi:hypothetical protein
MLIIMIVNCWFLYMGGSSTIFKQKILARRVAVGAGQVAVRSGGPPSDRGGRADRRVGSGRAFWYIRRTARPSASLLLFPLPWQELVRSSIWLVLKTIHWLLTLGKGEVHFSGGGELFAFCRCFFQVAHDAEDQEEGQNEDESRGIR